MQSAELEGRFMKKKFQACGSADHEIARRQFLGGMMTGGTVIGGLRFHSKFLS